MKLFSKPKKKTERRRYFEKDDIEALLKYVEENENGGKADHFRLWRFIYNAIPDLPGEARIGLKLENPDPYVWWEE